MSNPIAFVFHGHDNDSYMLQGCASLVRCPVCGELLERPRLVSAFQLRKKRDVSSTYDGYTIVSQKFIDEWQRIGGTGLEFEPLPEAPGFFVLEAFHEIAFDTDRRETRFEKLRTCCGRYHSVVGATPAFLKAPENLSPTRATRTDVMFGSGDEKHPLIIIPVEKGAALKRARLSGLDLSDVLA